MPELTWIVTTIIGAVAAIAAVWRVHVERQRNRVEREQNEVLRRQLELAERRADLRILTLRSTGGGVGYVDFVAEVANYGTQPCRCELAARVGDVAVECSPPKLDLVANTQPQGARVIVRRPQLGDLVQEFGHETTLYGRTLRVEADPGEGAKASAEWREHVYTAEENRARHEIQQRVWRIGRGEGTEADHHADAQAEVLGRHDERLERGW